MVSDMVQKVGGDCVQPMVQCDVIDSVGKDLVSAARSLFGKDDGDGAGQIVANEHEHAIIEGSGCAYRGREVSRSVSNVDVSRIAVENKSEQRRRLRGEVDRVLLGLRTVCAGSSSYGTK